MAGIVGIDVGGTFTDLFHSGNSTQPHLILKVPSTPQDPSIGLLNALQAVGLTPDELDAILHGARCLVIGSTTRRSASSAAVQRPPTMSSLLRKAKPGNQSYAVSRKKSHLQPAIPFAQHRQVEAASAML